MADLIRIYHRPSSTLLAQGKSGWEITPFEGNFYVRKKCLTGDHFRLSPIPGFCVYKFIYLWMDLVLSDGTRSRLLAWKYIIPNPLLPFIWFRVAIAGQHPEIEIQRTRLTEA